MITGNTERVTAQSLGDDVRKTVVDTGAFARDAFVVGKEKAVELKESSETYIKDNPWRSVLGTLAVGLVVGLFIGSRRRS